MSAQPWHRRYHSDALAGMLSLTLEERGAYQTVLDLIYDRGCPIADNERMLAGYMGCSIRKWRALREALIRQGKLTATEGFLSNSRAEKQLENDAKTRRKLAENGAKGGRNRAENAKSVNKNSDGEQAELKPGSSLPDTRSQSIPLPNGKGANDEDSDAVLWASARAYLGKSKGSMIGKWCRDYGQLSTAQAITAAQLARAVEPVAYIEKTLRRAQAEAEEVPLV